MWKGKAAKRLKQRLMFESRQVSYEPSGFGNLLPQGSTGSNGSRKVMRCIGLWRRGYVLFKAAMYRLCMGARSTCQRMLAGTADPSGTLRYCQSERVAVALGEGMKSNCSRHLVPGLAREFHFGLDIHMEGYHGIRHKRRLMFVLWQVSKKPSGFQKRFWIASVTLRSVVCISRFPIGLRSAWER